MVLNGADSPSIPGLRELRTPERTRAWRQGVLQLRSKYGEEYFVFQQQLFEAVNDEPLILPGQPLSAELKRRLAAFHERAAANEDPYWWHDPEYLEVCAAIRDELKDNNA